MRRGRTLQLVKHQRILAVLVCAVSTAAPGLLAQSVKDQLPPELPVARETGDSVQPVFEGWQRNADGTISMWFGYLNRNRKEIVNVPVGPANKFNVTSNTAVDS